MANIPNDDDLLAFLNCDGGMKCAKDHTIVQMVAFAIKEDLSVDWCNSRGARFFVDWEDE